MPLDNLYYIEFNIIYCTSKHHIPLYINQQVATLTRIKGKESNSKADSNWIHDLALLFCKKKSAPITKST